MDSSFVEQYNDKRSELILASQSSRSLNELRSIELDGSGTQESGKCHHFSIRGYVAEIRKTNKKICWPFHIVDSHGKLEDQANLLPPITVTEFRWWNCQNCLRKTSGTKATTENGPVMNSHSDEIKMLKPDRTSFHGNSIGGSQAKAPNLLSCLQVLSGEISDKARPTEADSFIDVNSSHCHQSLYLGEKDKEFIMANTIAKGTLKHEGSLVGPEEHQNLRTNVPTSGALDHAHLRKGDKNTAEIMKDMVCSKTHELVCSRFDCGAVKISEAVLQSKNAHDTMTRGTSMTETEMDTGILLSTTESLPEFSHMDEQGPSKGDVVKMKEKHDNKLEDYGIHREIDTCIPNDDSVTSVTVHRCKLGAMRVDETNLEASKSNENTIEKEEGIQHCASQLGTSDGNLHRRKAPKVRTLSDIIKSEVLGLSGKVHLSHGDNEVVPILDDNSRTPDASREKKLRTDCNSHTFFLEKEIKLFRYKNRNESPKSEDEGPSLRRWLKRMPKKVKTHNGDTESKHVYGAVVNPKPVADATTGRGLLYGAKRCEAIEGTDRKITGAKKQNKTSQVAVFTGNDHDIFENATSKQVDARINHPKSVRHECRHPDSPGKNLISSKKQNRTLQVEDGGFSSLNVLKDSFGTFESETVSHCQAFQKVSKKQRVRKINKTGELADGTPITGVQSVVDGNLPKGELAAADSIPITGEQAAVDGIPIEILELLQNNYQKKHPVNSECPNAHVSGTSAMNINVKDHKMLDSTCSTKYEIPSSQSLLNFYSNNTRICTTGKSIGNSNQESRGRISRGSEKNKRNVNVNQHKGLFTSKGFPNVPLCVRQPRNGIELPVGHAIGNYCTQNHSWQRIMLQNMEPCPEVETISRQNLVRYTPHGAFGINNSLQIHPDIYHGDILSRVIAEERKPNRSDDQTSSLKPKNSTVPHFDKIIQKVDVKTNKRTLSTDKVCLGAGKECHSKKMRPLDICTNDNISAMHLLRLMDPAVCSTAPLCASLDKNQTGFLNQSKHYHKEFLGLDAGVRTKGPSKNSGTLEHVAQNHNPGNSFKHSSPAPKVVLFGSVLQEGVPSSSNNHRTQFAFKGGHPNQVVSSSKIHGKEKTKGARPAAQTRVNRQISVSRDANSQDWLPSALNPAVHSEPCQASKHIVELGLKNKDEVDFPQKGSCESELCVVNRNPADFTIPDEDNVYMIGYDDLNPRDESPLRKRRFPIYPDAQGVMKLTAVKGVLRS